MRSSFGNIPNWKTPWKLWEFMVIEAILWFVSKTSSSFNYFIEQYSVVQKFPTQQKCWHLWKFFGRLLKYLKKVFHKVWYRKFWSRVMKPLWGGLTLRTLNWTARKFSVQLRMNCNSFDLLTLHHAGFLICSVTARWAQKRVYGHVQVRRRSWYDATQEMLTLWMEMETGLDQSSLLPKLSYVWIRTPASCSRTQVLQPAYGTKWSFLTKHIKN